MECLRHAVEGEVQEVARSAVRALRGVRLCAEGHEEGRLTHLVLGQQRRTLKVRTLLHAVLCLGSTVSTTGTEMIACAQSGLCVCEYAGVTLR